MTSRARHRKRALKAETAFIALSAVLGVAGLASIPVQAAFGLLAVGLPVTAAVVLRAYQQTDGATAREVAVVCGYSLVVPTVAVLSWPTAAATAAVSVVAVLSCVFLAMIVWARTRSKYAFVALATITSGVVLL